MKNSIKQIVKGIVDPRSKPYLYLYHNVYKKKQFPSLDHIILLFAREHEQVKFMQIGANEGSTEDPLYHHIILRDWRGILVEPLPDEFNQLKANYKNNPNLIYENVAISNKEESKPFFYVDKDQGDVPFWVTKLSSFDPSVTEQVKEVCPTAVVTSFDVKCHTATQILEKNGFTDLDLLLTDTEGFDFEILKTVDWNKVSPSMVVYEHRHLSQADRTACEEIFTSRNYYVFRDEFDTIAFTSKSIAEVYKDHLL